MARLTELLPYGHWNAIRLRRDVDLHAMVSSAGRSRETGPEYRWDGTARGRSPFAVVQTTIAGAGLIERDGHGFRVPAGFAMVAHVPDSHCYTVDPEVGFWDFAYVVLSGRELLRLLGRHAPAERPVVEWPASGGAESGLFDLVTALGDRRRRSPYDLSGLAYRFAMNLLSGPSDGEGSSIARVERYIREHLHEALTVERLAAVAGLSRYHFARRFSRSTGLPPVRYVREARCERAAHLLSTTGLSVKEIATDCGFEGSNYFCRVFRQSTGMSPGEFRRNRP